MDQKYITDTRKLLNFIMLSPSPCHAVSISASELEGMGFLPLDERKPFSIQKGKSYYVKRNSSALIAFTIPLSFSVFNIVSAHTDSPCLKIKWNPELKAQGFTTRLNVESYGGLILN